MVSFKDITPFSPVCPKHSNQYLVCHKAKRLKIEDGKKITLANYNKLCGVLDEICDSCIRKYNNRW